MALEFLRFGIETRKDKILKVLDRNIFKTVQDINKELGTSYTSKQVAFSLAGLIVEKKVEHKNLGTLDKPIYGWRLLSPRMKVEFEKLELEKGTRSIRIK